MPIVSTSLDVLVMNRKMYDRCRTNFIDLVALTATQQGNAAFKRLGFTRSDPASGRNLLQQGAEMVERRGNESFSRQLSRITTEEKMKSPRA